MPTIAFPPDETGSPNYFKKEKRPKRSQKKLGMKSALFFCLLSIFFLTIEVTKGMGTNKDGVQKKMITITQENNGQEIEVKSGDLFRIELVEMGSAGYNWYIDGLNTEVVELVSKETKVISEDRVGGPVMAIWLLKAKKAGKIEIKMDHYRIWEGKQKATKHFSIKLLIK
jgi:predicted secreted protein